MRRSTARLLCAALLLCSLAAWADEVEFQFFPENNLPEFELFAGVWKYNIGGDIANNGNREFTLDNDNGIKTNPQPQVLLHYGFHNHRWIPTLTAGYVHIGGAGQYLAPFSFPFGGINIVAGNTLILAGVNFNDYQIDADWHLFTWRDERRTVFEIEPGLALKYLAGHATVIANTTASVVGVPLNTTEQRFAIDQPVPLLHTRAEFAPWPWLRLEASGGYFALNGSHAGELRAAADLVLWNGISLTAGYQEQLYKVKSDPYLLHARFDGPTIGISVVGP